MERKIEHTIKIAGLVCMLMLIAAGMAFAAAPVTVSETNGGGALANNVSYCQMPPSISNPVPPLVMLMLEKDERLFRKAYDDATDIWNTATNKATPDGTIDSKFNNNVDYYGYFDSYKCYKYKTTDGGYFDPVSVSATKACNTNGTKAVPDEWSGNFLNWATMTRLDVVRKALYGGLRDSAYDKSTGAAPLTILERAPLPPDMHAFAKVVNSVTPTDTNITKIAPFIVNGTGGTAENTLTLCNVTWTAGGKPQFRITRREDATTTLGGYAFWAAGNRWQCAYKGEVGGTGFNTVTSEPFEVSYAGWAVRWAYLTSMNFALGAGGRTGNRLEIGEDGRDAYDYGWVYRDYATVIGQAYKYTIYTSATDSRIYSYVSVGTTTNDTSLVSWDYTTNTVGSWTMKEYSFIATAATTRVSVYFNGWDWNTDSDILGAKLYLDDVLLATPIELKPMGAGWENHRPVAPGSAYMGGAFNARVSACNAALLGKERCRFYEGKSIYKPIGLFQEYGEDSSMYFGLLTGTYAANKTGGVLRSKLKDIGDAASFEVNRTTGVFTSQSAGVLASMSKFNITGFDYATGTYSGAGGVCPPSAPSMSFADGQCPDWGNPLGEMFYEGMRYYMGKASSSAGYDVSDNAYVAGVWQNETWNASLDPWGGTKPFSACAPAFMLIMSDPYPSYDGDQVPGGNWAGAFAGDTVGVNVKNLAHEIGGDEGYENTSLLVGDAGWASGDCWSKWVTNFGEVRGICPSEPGSEGTWSLPALAKYANETDLRSATVGASEIDGDQIISTYAIALSPGQPEIIVKVNGKEIKFIPSCKNSDTNAPCNLIDFKLYSLDATSGTFFVTWDAYQVGGDYGMDMVQQITYWTNAATVWVYSQLYTVNPYVKGNGFSIGYIVTGSTNDGLQTGWWWPSSNQTMPYWLTGWNTYTPGTTGWVKTPKDPLWLAAKYGNRVWDSEGDGIPDAYFQVTNPMKMEEQLVAAFTKILARVTSGTSAAVIAEKQGSGANLVQAVYYPRRRFISNETSWVGTLQNLWYYQDPYFSASNIREDTDSDKALTLTKDYIIQLGYNDVSKTTEANLFKDTNGDNLSDTGVTPFKTVDFDDTKVLWEAGKQLWARDVIANPRKIYTTINKADFYDFTVANKATLKPFLNVQEAGDGVAGTDLETEDLIRWTLGETVVSDRNGADTDGDGIADGDGGYDLRIRSADIDLNGDGDAYDTVSLDINGDGTVDTVNEVNQWKLGDIITSTPKIQASFPLAKYDQAYGDTSYSEFYSDSGSMAAVDSTTRYKNRGVIYAGANDGMLHAFKLGRLDLAGVDYTPSDAAEIAKISLTNTDITTQNYFGKEIWAYIPLSGLPYLRFIAQNDYCHVNVVDLTSSVVDASVNRPAGCGTANQADCLRTKESWRTVLLGGMRLGGSCRGYSATQDAVCAGSASKDCLTAPLKTTVNGVANTSIGYSAYFAIDVTDPENPVLLWEHWSDDLGFSTTGPGVVRINGKDDDGVSSDKRNGNWFVVFGNGPTGPIDYKYHQFMGRSDRNLKYQVLDLYSGGLITTIDTGLLNSFSGSLVNASIDLDTDYQDDVLYAGYVKPITLSGTTTWTDGGVGRIVTSENPDPTQWRWSRLMDGIGPVTAGISKLLNTRDVKMSGDALAKQHLWVYFGTGRFYYKRLNEVDDNDETNASDTVHQRALFGITDPCFVSSNTATKTAVFKAECTDASTANDGTVMNVKANLYDHTTLNTTIQSTTADTDGWFINLRINYTDPGGKTFADERVVTDATTTTSGYALYTSTSPTTSDSCGIEGDTRSWAVKYDTGGLPSGIKGVMLVQTSTGAIKQIDLAKEFAETRVLADPIPGLASSDAPALSSSPPPVKRPLHIMER